MSCPPPTSVFLGSIFCVIAKENGSHPQEDLANFLLQAKYENNLNKKTSFYIYIYIYIWLPTWHHVHKSGDFSSILVEEMATD
jgi:hypothetical protein